LFSARQKVQLSADSELCQRCGDCEQACPSAVFSWIGDEIDVHHPGRCIGCGHCVAACPHGALSHSELPPDRFAPLSDGPPLDLEALRRVFRERRSCRRFSDQEIERARIEALIDEARHAPTSTNSQNVRFLVFAGHDNVRRLAEWTCGYYLKLERQLKNPFVRLGIAVTVGRKTVNAYRYRMPAIAEMFRETMEGNDRLFYGAPAVLVLFASGLTHLAAASCNLAAMQLLLSADASGLGAFFSGYALTALVRDKPVREQVGVPRGYTPGAVIAIGEPAGGFRFHRVPPRNKRRVIWFEPGE
jgi:nitroreductase/NAD-dependent dihydropyrimidine dehydrogenase PreA subunit